jgi:hypothetical protein
MSKLLQIDSSDSEEEYVLQTQKIKSKSLSKMAVENDFINQIYRKDVLENMLANANLTGKDLFNFIMRENKEFCDERRQGWVFETLCQILIILKCIENINYTSIYDGQLQNLKEIKNITNLLKVKVDGGGNNIVDMVIKQESTHILFTIKYKKKYSETDVSKIDNTIPIIVIAVNDINASLDANTITTCSKSLLQVTLWLTWVCLLLLLLFSFKPCY